MKTLGYLACSSELQLTQEYEQNSDSYLSLLDYDRIDRQEIEGAI
jgi:hypothetical protein